MPNPISVFNIFTIRTKLSYYAILAFTADLIKIVILDKNYSNFTSKLIILYLDFLNFGVKMGI